MKLTAEFNIEEKLKEPVDQKCLLQVINSLCTYTFLKTKKSTKIDLISDAIRVMTGLCNLDNERYRKIIAEYQNTAYQNGFKLGDEGHDLLTLAAAIKTSMTILDSDSQDWKAALKIKLNETIATLMLKLRKLKNKRKHKKLKVAKTTITHFCSQQNQHRQDSQVQEKKENTFKIPTENSF